MSSQRMTFGKYKGKLIHKIPSSYLLWVAENVEEDGRHADIVQACDEEWQWRDVNNQHIGEDS